LVIWVFQSLTQKHDADSDEEDSFSDGSDSLDITSVQDDSSQDEAQSDESSSQKDHISPAGSPSDQERDLSQDQRKAKKDAWDQLESTLRLFRQLITTTCLSLDPLRLVEDPATHLRLILDIQPQIDQTLDQIKCATNILCPKNAQYAPRNDQHLEELKSFKLCELEILRSLLWSETFEFIQACCESVERLGFSRAHSHSMYGALSRPWTARPEVLAVIDSVIPWLIQSEFDLVQRDWPMETRRINETLNKYLDLIHQRTLTRQNQAVIQLAKTLLVIPLIFDTDISLPGQNSFKTWFITWSNQFSLAIQNLNEKVDLFSYAHPQ
jgi:hypothetical protein